MKLSITIMSGQGTIHSYRTLYAILVCVTVISTFCVTNVTSENTTTTPQTNGTPSNTSTTTSQPSNGNETSTETTFSEGNYTTAKLETTLRYGNSTETTLVSETWNTTLSNKPSNTALTDLSVTTTASLNTTEGSKNVTALSVTTTASLNTTEGSKNVTASSFSSEGSVNATTAISSMTESSVNATTVSGATTVNTTSTNSSIVITTDNTTSMGSSIVITTVNTTSMESSIVITTDNTTFMGISVNVTTDNTMRSSVGATSSVNVTTISTTSTEIPFVTTNASTTFMGSPMGTTSVNTTSTESSVNVTTLNTTSTESSVSVTTVNTTSTGSSVNVTTPNTSANVTTPNTTSTESSINVTIPNTSVNIKTPNTTSTESSVGVTTVNTTSAESSVNVTTVNTTSTESPVGVTNATMSATIVTSSRVNVTESLTPVTNTVSVTVTVSPLCQNLTCIHGNCSVINKTASCSCDAGWQGDTCQTVCSNNTFGQNCTNTCNCSAQNTESCHTVNGTCFCLPGWNGSSCTVDIDECLQNKHNCTDNQHCMNKNGSFECVCNSGYFYNGTNICIECPNSTYGENCTRTCNCTIKNSYCDKVNGCHCLPGWNGTLCDLDIDECQIGKHNCNGSKHCVNKNGSYECVCNDGYTNTGNNTCVECGPNLYGFNCSSSCNCSSNHTFCHPGNGTCLCRPGWNGTSCEVDVDECSMGTTNNCTAKNEKCRNTNGSFECVCHDGYHRNGSGVCVDCTNNTFGYNCSSICMCTIGNTENCNHVNGTCVCLPGWNGSLCELDIDECKTYNCTKNEHCENRNGSFHCVCDRGYIRNSNNTCVECSNNTFGDNCTNTCNCFTQNTDSCNPVNGTCNCLHGWNGSSCEEDINECSQQKNICTDNAQCLNKNGSFECVCSTGYTRNSSNICAACTNNTYGENCTKTCNCTSGGNTQLCDHVNGTCVCSPGWNGTLCEKDINECDVNKHNCTKFEVCINTNGSFKCECASGSQRNASGFCNDINECSEKPCKNAVDCINSIGSYRCICQKGWIGINCSEDINECEKNDTCPDPNSVCTNENGTFSCPCKSGFERVLTDRNCTAEILLKNFNTSNSQAVTGDDNIFGPYNIPGGVSVNGKLLRVLYVSINGYMTFDTKVSQSSMPQMGSPFLSDLVVIAPYWTDIHILPESSGKLYLRELSLLDASKVNETQTVYSDIKDILAKKNQNVYQFCPIYAFVATWMNVLPFNASKFQNMQSATFQVIFITDGKQSFVIVNYRTIWPSTENLNVGAMFLIPSTAQNETWNPLASFPTRKVFSHSDLNVPTTSCSNAECINWQHVKRNIKGPVGTPCPCSLPQARADKLFKATPPDVEMACVEGKTYDSAGVKQVCCYDISTKMLYTDPSSFTKTALFKDPNVNQDVQKGHNLCCNNSSDRCFEFFTLFPPDTCKSYKAPKTALLWGDPHLLTLDGNEYSFNGWGDYVLLKTPDSTLQIQGRTEKLYGFNVTVFTAFAIKNANDPVIEIHLANNRTVVYLNGIQKNLTNGSFSTDTTFLEFENATTETSLLIVFYSEIAMQINAGSNRLSLSFDLRGNRLYNSTGLLGLVDENATNDFLFRNASSLTAADLKPEEIFQFGQSWLVTNTSESLFNSTIGVYNPDPSFVPTFLPSTVAEIMTKLNSSGKLAVAQELCFGNLACLQDFYITGSNTSATETKTIQENTRLLQEFLAKRPPEFVGMPEVWNVSVSKGTYRLTISLKADSNTSRISISRASSLNYTFNSNTSEFVWFLSPNLRNISDIAISFTAINADNMSALYQPKISLCACEQESQCDFSLSASNFTGNYYSSECHCGQNRAGKFCELQVDDCTMCFPNASCNTSATIGNLCGCPFGYTGDGIKCYEENECLRTENKPCQHICINTIGSYYCSCNPGYASLGNGQCGDIDECSKDNNCSKTQICKNTEGSYMCQCRPGYAGVACQKEVKSVFGGQLVFSAKPYGINSASNLTTGSPTFILLAEKVKNETFSTLNKSIPYLIDVEVIQLKWLGNKRRRRSAESLTIISTFQVYLNGIASVTGLNDALAAGFDPNCVDDYCTFGSMFGVMKTQSTFLVNYDLCTSDRNNDCHNASTICTSYGNGTVGCSCREGYQPWSGYSNVCEDINECTKNTTLCTNKENNETGCVNLPGSYSCTCQTGRWNATSMKCILYDKCGTASPCQNGECTNTGEGPGYVCKCAYGWTGLNCDAKDGEAERMKDTVIGLAAGLGSFCFILLIIIIVLCVLRTRSKGKKQNEYNGHYSIPRPGLISSEQVEMSRGESMHKYTEFRSRTLLDVDDEPPNHNGKARQKEYQNPTFQADEDHYLRL